MAKKKVHRPKKANATKPRRRPGGRGSGPAPDAQVWDGDTAAQRYLGPGDEQWLADGEETEESAAERQARLALLAEVEAVPDERVAAALLANPLVAHLGEVLLSGADEDASPVVAPPADGDLTDGEVAALARWNRAALLLDDRAEADELAGEWREGGEAQLLAARAALAQHLMAVVGGEPVDDDGAVPAWLGSGAAPEDAPEGAAEALLDLERGELVIDLVARLGLTGRVTLEGLLAGSPARELVLRDARLLAAAGLLELHPPEEGDDDGPVAVVDRDLRRVLLDVADDLVQALHDPDDDELG